jgi:hypothetical protein
MLNTPMIQEQQPQPKAPAKPNETSGLNIDEFVRITDPETQEIILEKRA